MSHVAVGGFSSYECPVCNKSILHYRIEDDLDKGWSEAVLVLKNGTLEGKYDGYGVLGGFDLFAAAANGKVDDKLDKNEKELRSEWFASADERLVSKKHPIKMYHKYCWENSGKPNFSAAKVSKPAKDQGHFINEKRYAEWPPAGPRENPAKEGKGIDGEPVRFEFKQGSSNKFWEYTDQEDGTALVRWGRIGSQGESQLIEIGVALKRAKEKQRKGYRSVTSKLMAALKLLTS